MILKIHICGSDDFREPHDLGSWESRRRSRRAGCAGGAAEVREILFPIEPNLTDREVAERVVTLLGLSLATPVQNFAIQHDKAHNLVLDFQHANGRDRVTFPDAARLRVEHTRRPLQAYLASLHTTSAAFHIGDWRMQVWAYYNEFAMWCLVGMIVTGAYLWLSPRAASRARLAGGWCRGVRGNVGVTR